MKLIGEIENALRTICSENTELEANETSYLESEVTIDGIPYDVEYNCYYHSEERTNDYPGYENFEIDVLKVMDGNRIIFEKNGVFETLECLNPNN